jgi:hypothetical protein
VAGELFLLNLKLPSLLQVVKTVLEQSSFSGINRKVQLKPTKWAIAPPAPQVQR